MLIGLKQGFPKLFFIAPFKKFKKGIALLRHQRPFLLFLSRTQNYLVINFKVLKLLKILNLPPNLLKSPPLLETLD